VTITILIPKTKLIITIIVQLFASKLLRNFVGAQISGVSFSRTFRLKTVKVKKNGSTIKD
jgi:hypothetical protein